MNSTSRTTGEYARRGADWFERAIRPSLRPDAVDQFVAIDVDTGQYELDRDDFAATERLLAKAPNAKIWLMRVGQGAAYRIGGNGTPGDAR